MDWLIGYLTKQPLPALITIAGVAGLTIGGLNGLPFGERLIQLDLIGRLIFVISGVTLACVGIFLFLRSVTDQGEKTPLSEIPPEFTGLRALIDSSDLPMYLADPSLKVRHCNDHLCRLADCLPQAILGKHVADGLLEHVKHLVPEGPRRHLFELKQKELMFKAMSYFQSPHIETEEFINVGARDRGQYQGPLRVWAHFDKIKSKQTGEYVGALVIFKPDPVSEIPPLS